jgi:rare lipoprotein A
VDQRKATLKVATLLLSAIALVPASAAQAQPKEKSGKVIQNGRASWYGPGFHGKKTASGETFNTNQLTAAHRTLPFGTKVRVVNKRTGKSVVVRINDRGPFAHGRVIDLSRASAEAIGISGVAPVTVAEL